MPDRLDLDERLAHSREDLFDTIDTPSFAHISRRGVALRRRRHARRAGTALLAVLAAAAIVVHPWTGVPTAPPGPADDPAHGRTYSDGGITINGLLQGAVVINFDGTITDVEFTDARHGHLVGGCLSAPPCPATFASTSDGGLTWTATPLVDEAGAAGEIPDLLAFPGGGLVLAYGHTAYAPGPGGSWRPTTGGPAPTGVGAGELLRASADGCGAALEVWSPRYGYRGILPNRPDLGVCWVAPAPAVDQAWWVGGIRDGRPAVAVTRDGGATWTTTAIAGPTPAVASVEVAARGQQVYATVLDDDRAVIAIAHSRDNGHRFDTAPTKFSSAGDLPGHGTLAGALIPLVDGSLLGTGGDLRWYLSEDDGRTFRLISARGNLPAVGRLARTPAGYVAYDLFHAGWAAYSADGTTWRKLQIN